MADYVPTDEMVKAATEAVAKSPSLAEDEIGRAVIAAVAPLILAGAPRMTRTRADEIAAEAFARWSDKSAQHLGRTWMQLVSDVLVERAAVEPAPDWASVWPAIREWQAVLPPSRDDAEYDPLEYHKALAAMLDALAELKVPGAPDWETVTAVQVINPHGGVQILDFIDDRPAFGWLDLMVHEGLRITAWRDEHLIWHTIREER